MGLTLRSLPRHWEGGHPEQKRAQGTSAVSFRSSCQPECLPLEQSPLETAVARWLQLNPLRSHRLRKGWPTCGGRHLLANVGSSKPQRDQGEAPHPSRSSLSCNHRAAPWPVGRTPASGTTLLLITPTDHSCGLGQVVLFCKMRARAWPLLIFFPTLAFCDLVILSFQWKTLPEEWS